MIRESAPHSTTTIPLARAAEKPAPHFDLLAPLYRWMEWITFGPWLHRCRAAFMNRAAQARHALVLGDGDGRFTARLLHANPTIEIVAADISPAMVRALTRRAGQNANRLQTHVADIRRWKPPATNAHYDIVVSHFFLDCLTTEEVSALAARLRPFLAPSALWIVSEFAIPRGWFGRLVAHPIVALLYRAFNVLTGLSVHRLPDHRQALEESNFTLIREHTHLRGLLTSQLWSKS